MLPSPRHAMRVRIIIRSRVSVAMFVAALLVLVATPVSAGASNDLVPDLRMRLLDDFHITQGVGSQPDFMLRFDTIIVNVGRGPFIVRGHRPCSDLGDCPDMTVRQRIRHAGGGSHAVLMPSVMNYAGDGHDHWHVMQMEQYELIPIGATAGKEPRRGAKVGYCFFDNVEHRLELPGAPQSPHFGGFGCGDETSTDVRMGLSVGWGDIYPWNFGYQWIDITDLSDGTYRVCATASPDATFVERNTQNNAAWQDITITGSSFELGDSGRTACTPPGLAAAPARTDYPNSYAIFGRPEDALVCRIGEPVTFR